jgi:hypothetical protein
MAEEPRNHDRGEADGPESSPRESLLRKTVTMRLIVIVLFAFVAVAGGATGGYFVGHNEPRTVKSSASGATPSATVAAAPSTTVSALIQPSPTASASALAARTSSVIPMSAVCKWAYPGQASGKISGTDDSIVCLGTSGQALGGFSGLHSLNAWCLDDRHTQGANLPDPELVNGRWICTGSGAASTAAASTASATSQAPQPSQAPPASQAPPTGQASPTSRPTPTARPSSPSAPAAVAIPIGAACIWAYPGQASGKFSGSNDSIVCLGTHGQALGGFSGSHSLNAWCADPSHTDNEPLPNPELSDGEWLCTA